MAKQLLNGKITNNTQGGYEMKLTTKIKKRVDNMTPYVAKHPKTGKWWAIDSYLKIPIGKECNTKLEAIKEWKQCMVSMIGDISTQNLSDL